MKKDATIETNYIHNNGVVNVTQTVEGHLRNKIAPGIYKVQQDPRSGEYFLKLDKDSYEIGKIYGKLQNSRAQRILKAYANAEASVGVLLRGLKGTGKTVLLKLIANAVVAQGLPVIAINEPFSGDEFNSFIESLGESMLIFDEFTKTYSRVESQNALLTLFDGLNSSKRLTLLTSNEIGRVNQFFIDRPGRILYDYNFRNLDEETFKGYLKDNLEGKKFKKDIKEVYKRSYMFTFDMLKAIVKECNDNYELTFEEVVAPLNITELKASVFKEIVTIKHSSGMVMSGSDLRDMLVVDDPNQDISVMSKLTPGVSEELQNKKKTKDMFTAWMYLNKLTFVSTKNGISSYTSGDITIETREVIK